MRRPERSGDKDEMCEIVEEYADELFEERSIKAIKKGFKMGLTKDMAKAMYPSIKKAIIDALYQESQKPTRGRKIAKA